MNRAVACVRYLFMERKTCLAHREKNVILENAPTRFMMGRMKTKTKTNQPPKAARRTKQTDTETACMLICFQFGSFWRIT